MRPSDESVSEPARAPPLDDIEENEKWVGQFDRGIQGSARLVVQPCTGSCCGDTQRGRMQPAPEREEVCIECMKHECMNIASMNIAWQWHE
jgi:hypothetical protein